MTPENMGLRAGVTLIILLAALLLGPRIARSVRRVPRLIETARERHAAGQGDQEQVEAAQRAREAKERESAAQPTTTSRWLGGFVLLCIWALAIYLVIETWLFALPGSRDFSNLQKPLGEFAQHLGFSFLITVVVLVVARALQTSLVASLQGGRINSNLILLAGRTIFAITLVIGLVAVLSLWGLGIVLPVTLIGALTVALSLSLQDILKNLVSGVYLLIERPFVIGDQITIAPYTGVVETISIRFTALRTQGGERVLVPNGMLFNSAVVNKSFYQRRLAGMMVTIPDEGPEAIETARERLLQTLETVPFALRTPKPEVSLTKAADGKVDLRVAFWLPVTLTEDLSGKLFEVMEYVRAQVPEAEVAPLDVI
ncbi:MAG TPA: mechanosensitive ion channel domain-containing protein [Ktedonobacterales bacterium]